MDVQPDARYLQATQFLTGAHGMGKGKLARLLGIKTPAARRLIERWRGETQGPGNHPLYLRVEQLKQSHPEWGAVRVSQALAISCDHARLHLARWNGVQAYLAKSGGTPSSPTPVGSPPLPAVEGTNQIEDSVCGDARDIAYRGVRIQSVEDLLVNTKVDTSVWALARHTVNIIERTAKNSITGVWEPQNIFSIRATLRRRAVELNLQAALDLMLQKFREAAPVQPIISYRKTLRGLLEISIVDLHLGKQAWAPEAGREYNADIAEQMFLAALTDLLGKASIICPERIVFVVGNDFFNVDGRDRATSNGTPQDEMLRWQDSFARGKALLIRAIKQLREIAEVNVICIPGNHDQTRLYYLGSVLEAYFQNTPGVRVDASPKLRKYVSYGKNLLGYCHGDGVPHDSLAMLMALEQPEAWSKSRHRAWGLGHYHVKKTKIYVPRIPFVQNQELHSVAIRIMPSLCPADAWHYSMGYSSKLAAEAHYWDPEDGCTITFTHNAP
jgi:hypothetical protein